MDAPIRDYVPMPPRVLGRKRARPFAAEYALLAELGLGR